MEKIKVVHLLVARTTVNGLNQLYFFTEKDGRFYWGTDKNSIEKEDIDELVRQRKILKLKEPIIIDEEQTLMIGGGGLEVYKSNPIKEELKSIGLLANIVI